jgi:hypothetical protein
VRPPEFLQILWELALDIVDLRPNGRHLLLQRREDRSRDGLRLVWSDPEMVGDPAQELLPVEGLGRLFPVPRAALE